VKYLVVGRQAREHALAWRLACSTEVEHVYVCPGNPTLENQSKLSTLPDGSNDRLVSFSVENKIDCVLVGPLGPMENGLVDDLLDAGIATLGANRRAAQLEGSKLLAKQFAQRHDIPIPEYQVCKTIEEVAALEPSVFPCMIKSDRVIRSHYSAIYVENHQQALEGARRMFEIQQNYYGFCGAVFVERYCEGNEVSFTVLVSGADWIALPTCQDYKKLGNDDVGPNTSGMGSVAPAPWLTPEQHQAIIEKIVEPTMSGLVAEGLSYRGFLYLGIMITDSLEPMLLEYNCRLGDPEAQSLLMLLEDDFANAALKAATGALRGSEVRTRPGCAVTVYLTPKGYPLDCQVGFPVSIPRNAAENVEQQCFVGAVHAAPANNGWISGNNRVMSISAYGATVAEARKRAYSLVEQAKGAYLFARDDIGEM
jgi:phosphoribosylamine---glycine ligase